jgi:hypothetical protein
MIWNDPRRHTTQTAKPSLEVLEDRIVPAIQLTLPFAPGVFEGMTPSLQCTATDSGGYSLTWSVSGLPSGETINASTGAISGTIAYSNVSSGAAPVTFAATVSVHDDHGSSTSGVLQIPVFDSNRLPTISVQNCTEGQTVSADWHASSLGTLTPTYSLSGAPTGQTVNASTGIAGGVIGYRNASGTIPAQFTATLSMNDGAGGIDTRLVTIAVTNATILTIAGTVTGSEGSSLSVNAGGSAGAGVTWSISGVSDGLNINASTGAITGIPGYAIASLGATATVSVGDALGTMESRTVSFLISDTNRLPNPGTLLDGVSETVSQAMAATDNSGTNTLSYSISGLPPDLTLNISTGVITGTVASSAAAFGSISTYHPVLTLTDNHGGTDTRSLTWVISNPGFSWSMTLPGNPTVTSVAAQSNAEGDSINLTVHASDPSYTPTFTAINLPDGVTMNSSTGVISGTIGYQAAENFGGSYTPVVIVTDGHGGASAISFGWTISDTPRPPTLAVSRRRAATAATASRCKCRPAVPIACHCSTASAGSPTASTSTRAWG